MRGILSACALYCGFIAMPEAEASVQINIDLELADYACELRERQL